MTTRRGSLWQLLQFCVLLLLAHALWGFDPFRTENDNVETGNSLLQNGKIKEALERYDAAAKELPDSTGVQYNRGVALYRLGRYEEARQALTRATAGSDGAAGGTSLSARSFFNLGNTQFQLKRYKEAALAYTRVLQRQPRHRAAKWNLELALRKIEQEKKRKQKQQDKDKKKNKQNDKNKKDKKQQKDKKSQQDEKQQPQKQGDKQKKQQPQQKKDAAKKSDGQQGKGKNKPQKARPPTQKQLQKKRMNQVLDALDRNDKNLQKRRLLRRSGGYRKPSKDW